MTLMVSVASAATITVNNIVNGQTYTAYKLLNYTTSGTGTNRAFSYYLTGTQYGTASNKTALATVLEAAGFTFAQGTDMRILDEDHISIECVDINIDFIFKLKSMIIVMPDSLSRSTPFLLFESEDDQSPKEKLPAHPNPLNYNDDYVEGYLFSDGNEGFDANEVYNSLMRIAYDPDSQNEADYRVKQYFMKRKIIAAISIPSLIRPDFLNFLNNNQDKDGHVVEIELKTGYRNKKVVP